MFNFAMTSGLASDSDKFKITITLRRAQKFLLGFAKRFARFFKLDKYAMFSFAMTSGLASDSDKFKITITLGGGWIAQAWATWPEGASAPNGTVMCRGHGVPEMVTPAMRTTAVLLGFLTPAMRQFCSFFKLDKYAMFCFAMTSGLASDSDKFKITITLLGFLTPAMRQFCSVF